ncbi:hypothetical protein Leryth_015016 [Lithospermum erythrorhizon]|nr:hypothetical protein Leryth_015016 [Lithospermum erythrorhizon]
MATNFAKPENALKRAEELINVGQKEEALKALHGVIVSRRHRAWTKTLERIMFKHIELCVDMRKGRIAKEGLIQYRMVCQQVNVNSLEEIIKHYMHLHCSRACSQMQCALDDALDVDDLEADKKPEDLMLSYAEKGKDYLKFHEQLQIENLYAMAAHRAFQFCKEYKRTTEFRRLCEIIRNHLANLNKYRDQRDRPDLTAPESLQLYLDTRVEQLKIATELELWQEAFRSVEDIHGLMCIVKKHPKASLMGVYYAKLTEIFWTSSSQLFHAYAWLKLFSLQKSFNKKLNQNDLQLIASSVVLLAAPPYDLSIGASHLELENEKDRNIRMANLIGFNLDLKLENREVLSRSSLLAELVSKGVMSCVTQEVEPLLDQDIQGRGKLSAAALPEVKPPSMSLLEKLATLRLLQQVSQVYQTVKIENLSEKIPFIDFSLVEKISVDAMKHKFISMKVDHMKGTIIFSNPGLESESVRDQLMIFAEHLNKSRSMIYTPAKKATKLGEILPSLTETVEKEHKRLLARKLIIEKRKEEQERLLLEMEREEETKRLRLQKLTEEAEQKRLASEYEQRKNQRILKEIEERELEEAQALLQEAEKRKGRKGKKPLIEGEKVTKQSVMELALSEQLRERQEMEKKLQKLAKTMDYLERAKREEAAPLIEAAYQQRLEEERVLHEREQEQEVEFSRQRHDGDLREKGRLSRMLENKMQFEERLLNHRRAEYERLRGEREERVNQILQSRKQEREMKRKMLFFLRSEEERLNKEREEEEARKREEAEKRKREEAERKAKLDEIAAKQRQREMELEEKERLRKEELLGRSPEPTARSALPDGPPPDSGSAPAAPAQGAPSPARYVPKFRRAGLDNSRQAPPPGPTRVNNRW